MAQVEQMSLIGIMNHFEKSRKDFIEKARIAARHFCHSKKYNNPNAIPHTVSMDDLRELMGIESKKDRSNNVNGQIFRSGFVKICQKASSAPGSHGNLIWLWTLPEYENCATTAYLDSQIEKLKRSGDIYDK